jgi:hypothetical protein
MRGCGEERCRPAPLSACVPSSTIRGREAADNRSMGDMGWPIRGGLGVTIGETGGLAAVSRGRKSSLSAETRRGLDTADAATRAGARTAIRE